jgi:hypothetical protein
MNTPRAARRESRRQLLGTCSSWIAFISAFIGQGWARATENVKIYSLALPDWRRMGRFHPIAAPEVWHPCAPQRRPSSRAAPADPGGAGRGSDTRHDHILIKSVNDSNYDEILGRTPIFIHISNGKFCGYF